jgi:DNA excision repair protein ERCC-8
MNQLLFDRSTGNLGPHAFARIQTSQLVHAIQPAPRLRFDGGEKETVPSNDSARDGESPESTQVAQKIWAHQAGVNALSVDIENRM